MAQITLTVLMPCLNEAEAIAFCIGEAKQFIEENRISAEILIVDNGSVDDSVQIAESLGARVVQEKKQGYGYAIRAGIREAKGSYIIMGDCDGSYDFYHIGTFLQKLKDGYSLVVGNRFNKSMEKNAMPFLHRYVGVPVLSTLARYRFGIKEVHDFHCGLRGFVKAEAVNLTFHTGGMEFATEMIAVFAESGARIGEISVTLRKDKRSGPSHLRTFRDGWRHLNYILKRRKTKRQPQ